MKPKTLEKIEEVILVTAAICAAPGIIAAGILASPALIVFSLVESSRIKKQISELKKRYGDKYCEHCRKIIDDLVYYGGDRNRHEINCPIILSDPNYCKECEGVITYNHDGWCSKYDPKKEYGYCEECEEVIYREEHKSTCSYWNDDIEI